MKLFRSFVPLSAILALSVVALAQTGKSLTADDYARAEKMLGYNTSALVDRAGVRPMWLPDGRFWYMVLTPTGREYVIVNPATGEKKTAATQAELGILPPPPSEALSREEQEFRRNSVLSPDGKKRVIIKDWNLWVRDEATKEEKQLTKDGVKDFGYATDNAGWTHSDRAIVLWSPDSKKVATYQQDQRHLKDMYLVTTNVGSPKLEQWKYPLPGDKEIAKLHRVIIDVDAGTTVRFKMEPDEHRGTLSDDISTGDMRWSDDATSFAFISSSRDHKSAKLRIANAATGDVRDVFEDVVKTQYESGQGNENWEYFPATNEAIWYSERDDWGHLYLLDLTNGKIKNQITKGNFVVTQIVKIDRDAKVIYFEANGREAGRDPYFSHFYRVDMDGRNMTLLTPEDGNHQVTLSLDGKYFIDNYSKPDVPPVAVLRDTTGKLIADLEKGSVERLAATGWKPVTPIKVKSNDGKWDLYGLMFTPTNLDKSKKYPVVNYIYPGPQAGGVGSRSFSASRGDHQALAELGFIVVVIDGSCNPDRSKSFHDVCYGNMADNTLEDQIAGLKQLATQHPYMDLDRVGMWGHSGGGFATAAALFRFPDFYKVGVSQSGNHDNRNYEDDWGERYIGLLVGDNYEKQANQVYAKNLKGKLMLAHGGMDDNVPPYNTYLVVDALNKANKDYDLVIFPNARHGYGGDNTYMMRRRWDYFVKHLMGAEPPKEHKFAAPKPDPRTAALAR